MFMYHFFLFGKGPRMKYFPKAPQNTYPPLALGESKLPHSNTENAEKKNIIHTEYILQLDNPQITDDKSLLDPESNIETHS